MGRSDLEMFIALANLSKRLPPGTSLPEPSTLQPQGQHREMLKSLREAFEQEFLEREALDRFGIRTHSLRFRDGRAHYFVSAEALYPLFHSVRTALTVLVDGIASGAVISTSKGSTGATVQRLRRIRLPPPSMGAAVFLQTDGTAELERDTYAKFLEQLDGADLTRLRRCPVCKRFFWARRSDQKACMPKCANAYRVREHRRHQAEKARKRRESRGKKARAQRMAAEARKER